MKILITGGLGYIGGRITNFLRDKEPGCELFLTTRNKVQRPRWVDRNIKILEMDVRDDKSIRNCLSQAKVDLIIHLAAINEIASANNPELALEVNTRGTYRLLDIARNEGIKKVIYFSTFHVYGMFRGTIIDEKTPTRPFHPYAITHRAAEDQVNYFRHYHDFQTLILRLSNGYGYPMDKGIDRWTLVFNDLCRQAVTEGKIVLHTSGKQYRDFISLRDVARAVHHFVFIKKGEWEDGLFNLGGDCVMSIINVAEKISEIYKARYRKKEIKIMIKSRDSQSSKPKKFRFRIDKLIKTGFQLEGNMDYEIDKTMDICEQFKN